MTKVCITGAAGFIGSHLTEEAVERGLDVVAIDDLATGFRENLEPGLDQIDFHQHSIMDREYVEPLLEDVDRVFHQAAIPSVPRSMERPVETTEVNLVGTIRMMQASVEAGVDRFVYASSSSVYGNREELPKHETMDKQPESPYAQAKSSSEDFAQIYADKFDLHTVGLRYFNVFGPRQNPDSQYSAVVPNFITALLDGNQGTIFGDGEQSRDFTFVKDVVRANFLAGEKAKPGRVYNVAYDQQMTVNQLHETIAGLCSESSNPNYEEPRPGDVRHSRGDPSRFHEDTGFEPEFTVEQGLKETVEFYRRKN